MFVYQLWEYTHYHASSAKDTSSNIEENVFKVSDEGKSFGSHLKNLCKMKGTYPRLETVMFHPNAPTWSRVVENSLRNGTVYLELILFIISACLSKVYLPKAI